MSDPIEAPSLAIIMEGYDMKLVGSLFAQPAFQEKYGQQLPDHVRSGWHNELHPEGYLGASVWPYYQYESSSFSEAINRFACRLFLSPD
jgi:hypothetical protein